MPNQADTFFPWLIDAPFDVIQFIDVGWGCSEFQETLYKILHSHRVSERTIVNSYASLNAQAAIKVSSEIIFKARLHVCVASLARRLYLTVVAH